MTERRYRTRRVAALERASSTSSETESEQLTIAQTTSQASSVLVEDEHSSPLPEQISTGSALENQFCIKCQRTYTNVRLHMKSKHQGELNAQEAEMYGFQLCCCGTFTKELWRHWGQYCKLPKSQRGRMDETRDSDARSVGSVSQETDSEGVELGRVSEVKALYKTLANDDASETEIYDALRVLAKVPGTRKVYKQGECSEVNRCVSRICRSYLQYRRNIDLFRLHAIVKVGVADFLVRGRLGKLRSRLRKFPYLDDSTEFEKAWSNLEEKISSSYPDDELLEKRVHRKLSKGLMGSAFKMLEDTLGVASASPETIDKLRALHPDESENLWPIRSSDPEVKFSKLKVVQCIKLTSKETAGGISGLDGGFLNVVKHNENFHDLMTDITKKISAGTQSLPQLFLSSRLVPLRKNIEGDVRPIAVGELLYRIAAKVLARSAKFELLDYQFGVKTRNGVEPLLHLAQLRGQRESLLSIDLSNAFNSMKRRFIFKAIEENAETLKKYFSWAYGRKSWLFLDGHHVLDSSCGVRQGDPLGPLCFSLGYAVMLRKLKESLVANGIQRDFNMMAYLDDTYFFAHRSEAARVLQVTKDVFDQFHESSGLAIKEEKTWVVSSRDFKEKGISMLGSHVGGDKDVFVEGKAQEFALLCSKLKRLRCQDGLLLLRTCGIPKINHLMRSMKVDTHVWERFDVSIRDMVTSSLARFDVTELSERIMSLPMRDGGLGLCLPSKIAGSCFQASHDESFKLLERRARELILPSIEDVPKSQRERVSEIHKETLASLENELTSFGLRKFKDNSSQLGSLFLQAVPCDRHSTFSDVDFSSALACRLLVETQVCRKCNTQVEDGHDQSCKYLHGLRVKRHEMVKSALARALSDAGAETIMEVPAANNQAHRCDVIARGQICGGNVAIDVSGVATVKVPSESDGSGFSRSQLELNSILDARVSKKRRENEGLNYGGTFLPFIFTTGGTLNKDAVHFLKKIQKASHRVIQRLKIHLSCILAKSRGMMWINCKFAPI